MSLKYLGHSNTFPASRPIRIVEHILWYFLTCNTSVDFTLTNPYADFPGDDLRECRTLRLIGALVDGNHASTIDAMDRIRPTENPSESTSIKPDVVVHPFVDPVGAYCLTGSVRRNSREVTGTSVGTVTTFTIVSFPLPFAHRFHVLLDFLNSVRTEPAHRHNQR
jgi:hypothetical protein